MEHGLFIPLNELNEVFRGDPDRSSRLMPLVNSGLNHHMVARHDPDTYHLSCGDFVWTLDVLEMEFELDERMVIMETCAMHAT